jgi:hypothetical protein
MKDEKAERYSSSSISQKSLAFPSTPLVVFIMSRISSWLLMPRRLNSRRRRERQGFMGLPLNRRTLVSLVLLLLCGIVVWFFGREWRWENTIIPSCCFIFLRREKKDKRFGTIYAPLNGQIALSWVFRETDRASFSYGLDDPSHLKRRKLDYTPR